MVKSFKLSECIKLHTHLPYPQNPKRLVCPDCFGHHQGDTLRVRDCKNLILNEIGQVIGQCCCFSEIHGLQGE